MEGVAVETEFTAEVEGVEVTAVMAVDTVEAPVTEVVVEEAVIEADLLQGDPRLHTTVVEGVAVAVAPGENTAQDQDLTLLVSSTFCLTNLILTEIT